jgi:hypothetical protein
MRIIIFVLFFFLVGCTPTGYGNKSARTMSDILVLGVTTKNDLRRECGNPTFTEVSTKTGYEYWSYIHSKTTMKSEAFIPEGVVLLSPVDTATTDNYIYILKLQFDEKDILKDYVRTTM